MRNLQTTDGVVHSYDGFVGSVDTAKCGAFLVSQPEWKPNRRRGERRATWTEKFVTCLECLAEA